MFWTSILTSYWSCRYELYDPCTVMFFFRNKHIMIDLGTGNNNKINWPLEDKQEMVDILETVYRGARKGRGLVVSPKDYSTKYRYWAKPRTAGGSRTNYCGFDDIPAACTLLGVVIVRPELSALAQPILYSLVIRAHVAWNTSPNLCNLLLSNL